MQANAEVWWSITGKLRCLQQPLRGTQSCCHERCTEPAEQVLDFDLINSLYSIKLYKKLKNHNENYRILKIFLSCKKFRIRSKPPFKKVWNVQFCKWKQGAQDELHKG